MRIIYTVTIFLSAFLIFLVQPMMAKILLPFLGGTSAVWNTSMVFYQLLLLGGYIYAHLGLKFLGAKKQAILHITLLLVSMLMLPLTLRANIDIVAAQQPILWMLAVLFLSVGLPFFLLSANAPLLQSWFARTSHKNASNPYFLYSASNLASFFALLGYPIIFEPLLGISQQMNSWSILYLIFTVMLVISSVALYKFYKDINEDKEQVNKDNNQCSPNYLQKLKWIMLAFIPSSLMLGVTTYITTDIASFPLLWVIPLSLYLLTFVFAFAPKIPFFNISLKLQLPLILLVILFLVCSTINIFIILALHLSLFFVTSMLCHGQLAKIKPQAKYLTEFFLWVSFGGVLGGMFNSLLAPVIFNSVVEYQLILILAFFFRPFEGKVKDKNKKLYYDLLLPLILFTVLSLMINIYYNFTIDYLDKVKFLNEKLNSLNEMFTVRYISTTFFMLVFSISCFFFRKRPLRLGFGIFSFFLVFVFVNTKDVDSLYKERSFFGVLQVQHFSKKNYISLVNGTTLHGIQRQGDESLQPTTYYGTPLKELFLSRDKSLIDAPVAIVGLGVGTAACYGREGQKFDFYEISKSVRDVALNRDYFTFLSDCPPKSKVIIGDGRLELAKTKEKNYGVILMDAFSSDSIPIHLLTSEALDVYLEKIDKDGFIAFHISNRHFDLAPVLLSLAREKNLLVISKVGKEDKENLVTVSHWVILTKNQKQYNDLKDIYKWQELPESNLTPWTDDYSNILQLLF